MAELERLIGVDEVLALHGAIVGSIPLTRWPAAWRSCSRQ